MPLLEEAVVLESRFPRAHAFLVGTLAEVGNTVRDRLARERLVEAKTAVAGYVVKNPYEGGLLRPDPDSREGS